MTHFRFLGRLYVNFCDVSDSWGSLLGTQGIRVPSFDWVLYVNVYMVLVCGHSWLMF